MSYPRNIKKDKPELLKRVFALKERAKNAGITDYAEFYNEKFPNEKLSRSKLYSLWAGTSLDKNIIERMEEILPKKELV